MKLRERYLIYKIIPVKTKIQEGFYRQIIGFWGWVFKALSVFKFLRRQENLSYRYNGRGLLYRYEGNYFMGVYEYWKFRKIMKNKNSIRYYYPSLWK
jgi:hypothetical protein